MKKSLPNEDAEGHIKHVLSLCIRSETPDAQPDEFSPQPWELIAEQLREQPETLVDWGLLTQEEFDECDGEVDEEWIEDIALILYEEHMAHTYFEPEYDEYEGRLDEGDHELDWFKEESLRLRDLIFEAKQALGSGDSEQLLGIIDDIYDEIGWEPESLGDVAHWAQLLVDSRIASGEKSGNNDKLELLVIQAVRSLAARLCEIIALDGSALDYVEWRQLEEVIAVALEGIGFEVTLTPPSRDGGKDVVANCVLHGHNLCFFIEIKHWRSGKRVGSKPVFDFVEINVNSSSDGGLFLSTSGFDQRVFTHLSELERSRVRIGGDQKVIGLCQHYIRRNLGIWSVDSSLPEVLFEDTAGELADGRTPFWVSSRARSRASLNPGTKDTGQPCGRADGHRPIVRRRRSP